jgi:hypothetical protein
MYIDGKVVRKGTGKGGNNWFKKPMKEGNVALVVKEGKTTCSIMN